MTFFDIVERNGFDEIDICFERYYNNKKFSREQVAE